MSAVLHGCHTRLDSDSTFRRWWFVDADGEIAGKLAAKIVKVIMGKHKPIYDRSQNLGDFVVVVNADKVCRIEELGQHGCGGLVWRCGICASKRLY